jgi:hypothetical protein
MTYDEPTPPAHVYVLPDDPRAWEAITTRPDDDTVHQYRTIRTFLSRWHRWVGEWHPIRDTDEFTEITLPDGIAVRAYGRIVADSGEDITESYIGESDGSPPGL